MSAIRFHNTLTRQLDEFVPIKPGVVTLYTCGPTVYTYPQIGNWVAYIRWDTLVRMLEASGYQVTRVMNITDVGHLVSDADDGEDKLEKGARREGKTAWEVADFYTKDFLLGMQAFNLKTPTHITKATDFITQQVALVQTLADKGYTYVIDDGVYFDTSKFATYADFAHLDLEALRAGARVDFNDQKRNVSDFALWKFTPAGEKRDMEWDSPWGRGFPGWHLECSAMAFDKLGDTIDIHTGGIDHIPVHHTNEIAQSEAATDKRFANYWLHNSFLMVDGAKASKSLGNAYTLQDLQAKGYDALDFRMFVLQSHYRTESNFTWTNLDAARNRLNHWRAIADLRWQPYVCDPTSTNASGCESPEQTLALLRAAQDALHALQNDLDTPGALASIDEAFAAIADGIDEQCLAALEALLGSIESLLGLPLAGPDISDEQKALLEKRRYARNQKDWAASDSLRDELTSQGITVRDSKNGQIWSRTT